MKYKLYICDICGCRFAVNINDVRQAERDNIYLTCPIHGKHRKIRLYKELTEERKAVRI